MHGIVGKLRRVTLKKVQPVLQKEYIATSLGEFVLNFFPTFPFAAISQVCLDQKTEVIMK